jgi:5-methylcytosine-specific restriction endonuclease McrA
MAKEKGFGLWMKGRTNFHSEATKQLFSERWKGANNPRWKGGVARSVTHKNWLRAHPQNVRHHGRIRRAIKRGARGKYTLGEWLALKRAYLFTCPACARTEPVITLTRDHIVPISRGGSNYIDNIQPLCTGCNARKWARTKRFDSSLIVAKFKSTIAA